MMIIWHGPAHHVLRVCPRMDPNPRGARQLSVHLIVSQMMGRMWVWRWQKGRRDRRLGIQIRHSRGHVGQVSAQVIGQWGHVVPQLVMGCAGRVRNRGDPRGWRTLGRAALWLTGGVRVDAPVACGPIQAQQLLNGEGRALGHLALGHHLAQEVAVAHLLGQEVKTTTAARVDDAVVVVALRGTGTTARGDGGAPATAAAQIYGPRVGLRDYRRDDGEISLFTLLFIKSPTLKSLASRDPTANNFRRVNAIKKKKLVQIESHDNQRCKSSFFFSIFFFFFWMQALVLCSLGCKPLFCVL